MKQNYVSVDVDKLVDRISAKHLYPINRFMVEDAISVTLEEVNDQLWGNGRR